MLECIFRLVSNSLCNLFKSISVFNEVRALLKMFVDSTFKLNYTCIDLKLASRTIYLFLAIGTSYHRVYIFLFIFIIWFVLYGSKRRILHTFFIINLLALAFIRSLLFCDSLNISFQFHYYFMLFHFSISRKSNKHFLK